MGEGRRGASGGRDGWGKRQCGTRALWGMGATGAGRQGGEGAAQEAEPQFECQYQPSKLWGGALAAWPPFVLLQQPVDTEGGQNYAVCPACTLTDSGEENSKGAPFAAAAMAHNNSGCNCLRVEAS